MSIIQIAALGLIGAILSLTLRQISPEAALFVSIITGTLIFMGILGHLSLMFDVLKDLSAGVSINDKYIGIIMKVVGIAYIAQFGMEICKDAGESAIASKIELGGKALIITVSIPVITGIVDTIMTILPV